MGMDCLDGDGLFVDGEQCVIMSWQSKDASIGDPPQPPDPTQPNPQPPNPTPNPATSPQGPPGLHRGRHLPPLQDLHRLLPQPGPGAALQGALRLCAARHRHDQDRVPPHAHQPHPDGRAGGHGGQPPGRVAAVQLFVLRRLCRDAGGAAVSERAAASAGAAAAWG